MLRRPAFVLCEGSQEEPAIISSSTVIVVNIVYYYSCGFGCGCGCCVYIVGGVTWESEFVAEGVENESVHLIRQWHRVRLE